MDVDQDENPKTLELFDLSYTGFPFQAPVPHNIETRRALLTDALIFDLLLTAGGITGPSSLYPPEDAAGLTRLLSAIERCTYDRLKKDGLVYYLLKWHDADGNHGRAQQYALDRSIPPQFTMLADAYWALDNGVDLEQVVSLLSDRRLARDYVSKILNALALGITDASTTGDIYYPHTHIPAIHITAPLILRYIRSAKPLLVEPLDMDLYLVALAEGDGAEANTALTLNQAWNFQRTFPEGDETRERLFRLLLDWCLTPAPRAAPLRAFLALPLPRYEQELLKDHALNPPPHLTSRSLSALRDLAIVRLLTAGMHAAALGLDRQFAAHAPTAPPPTSSRANYAAAAKAARAAREDEGALRRRADLLVEVRAAMPAAERAVIDAELSLPVPVSISAGPRRARVSAADLSASWMDVDASMLSDASHAQRPSGRGGNAHDPPHAPPIAETAGAPRFGLRAPRTSDTASAGPVANGFTKKFAPRLSEPFPPVAMQQTQQQPRASLFETTGSANRARNAFYQPRVAGAALAPAPATVPVMNGLEASPAQVAARQPVGQIKLPFAMEDDEDADVSRFDQDDMSIADVTVMGEMAIDELDEAQEVDGMIDYEEGVDEALDTPTGDETLDAPDLRELSFSVFSPADPSPHPLAAAPTYQELPEEEPMNTISHTSESRKNGRPSSGLARTETERMQPPGAFFTPTPAPEEPHLEEEEEADTTPSKPERPRAARGSLSPAPQRHSTRRVSASASTSKAKQSAKAREAPPPAEPSPKRARHAIPGAMEAEDDDDGTPVPEEAADVVPPLPKSTRAPRHARRRSSVGTVSGSEDEAAPQQRRRSLRLSHADLDEAPMEREVRKKTSRPKASTGTPAATPRSRRKR